MLLRLFTGLVVPSELPEAFKTCVDDATYQAHVEFLFAGLQTHTDILEREAPSVKLTTFLNLNDCFLVPDPAARRCALVLQCLKYQGLAEIFNQMMCLSSCV